jgi:hypothetical protein
MHDELTYLTFIPHLVQEVPELLPAYEEHLRDYDELLPHVFMGDVTRFVIDAYQRASTATGDARHWSQVLDRLMALLEAAAASSDIMLVNLVTVSFCENLLDMEGSEPSTYEGITGSMGPRLTEQTQSIYKFWNGQANT